MKKMPIAALISGSGTNLQAIIDACAREDFPADIKAVVSNKAEAFGLERARQAGIPAFCVPHQAYQNRRDHEAAIVDKLAPFDIELLVLAGYMRVVTPFLLDRYYDHEHRRPGVINIHPADTRAYQGAHGYEFALGMLPEHPQRLSETKITVHFVDAGVDTGSIIRQAPVEIRPDDTIDDLRQRGLAVEHQVYPEVIRLLATGGVSLET